MVESNRNDGSDVTGLLRDAILAGLYLPSQRLVESDLASLYNANRANVRIALAVLEQEGLVERQANRGASVRSVTESEALEIIDARMALEVRVAYLAAERAIASDHLLLRDIVSLMRVKHDADDYLGVSDLNAVLHGELQRVAANQTINRLLQSLKSRTVRLQFRAILIPGRAKKSMQEHEAIVDAVIAGDCEAAERQMRQHIQSVADNLKEAMRVHRMGLL